MLYMWMDQLWWWIKEKLFFLWKFSQKLIKKKLRIFLLMKAIKKYMKKVWNLVKQLSESAMLSNEHEKGGKCQSWLDNKEVELTCGDAKEIKVLLPACRYPNDVNSTKWRQNKKLKAVQEQQPRCGHLGKLVKI